MYSLSCAAHSRFSLKTHAYIAIQCGALYAAYKRLSISQHITQCSLRWIPYFCLTDKPLPPPTKKCFHTFPLFPPRLVPPACHCKHCVLQFFTTQSRLNPSVKSVSSVPPGVGKSIRNAKHACCPLSCRTVTARCRIPCSLPP